MENAKFVVFMTSNNEALAQALKKIANGKTAEQSLISIVNNDAGEELVELELKDSIETARNKSIDKNLTKLLDDVNTATATTAVQEKILEMINTVMRHYGAPEFKDPADAQKWLNKHADKFTTADLN